MRLHQQTIYYLEQELKQLRIYSVANADLIKDIEESIKVLKEISKGNNK